MVDSGKEGVSMRSSQIVLSEIELCGAVVILSVELAQEELLVVVSRAADCSHIACRSAEPGERDTDEVSMRSISCCWSLILRPGTKLYG